MSDIRKAKFDSHRRFMIPAESSGSPFSSCVLEAPAGLLDAAQELLIDRKPLLMGSAGLVCDPDTHADADIIRSWLNSTQRNADEFEVIFWLAVFAREAWAQLPKRTPSQHRKTFARIARMSRDLEKAITETGGDVGQGDYNRGGGYGLNHAYICDLMTENEIAHVDADARYELPKMNDLLLRFANAAERLEKEGPIHSQPTKRGAERGYFVRRMGELFQRRYGEQPHEVIAALTTVALGEATDRELVAKLLA